ncbi:MAG: hypothetical protein WC091_15525 [Sulfuricellaceae bacterium]
MNGFYFISFAYGGLAILLRSSFDPSTKLRAGQAQDERSKMASPGGFTHAIPH